MSVWAFENDSDHEIEIDTGQCIMLSLDQGSDPVRPYEVTQRLDGKTETVKITDGNPMDVKVIDGDVLLFQEKQPGPSDATAWPVLTIPPKSKTAVVFSYQSWRAKKVLMDIVLNEAGNEQKYHYQFKLSK
ncbi:MAG: hypothetical protein HUU46_16645 [Candidatus Hydrogenedentes bacterium]|nr:hypothetical protein [Candidatus Hydrogenedentota bacterium]